MYRDRRVVRNTNLIQLYPVLGRRWNTQILEGGTHTIQRRWNTHTKYQYQYQYWYLTGTTRVTNEQTHTHKS